MYTCIHRSYAYNPYVYPALYTCIERQRWLKIIWHWCPTVLEFFVSMSEFEALEAGLLCKGTRASGSKGP